MLPSSVSVRLSSVVLPAPGDDMRFTARTPALAKARLLASATRSFSAEQVLENVDPNAPRVGVAAVIADLVSVLVAMLGSVRVQVHSSHRYASVTSIDTTRNSSPLSRSTSKLSQAPHMSIGMANVVSA